MTKITKLPLLAMFAGFTLLSAPRAIPQGAKVFISPMGGFETYIEAAVQKKKEGLLIISVAATCDRGAERPSRFRNLWFS